jgi:hypothetical protein
MKTFNQLFETGNSAADFKVKKDDDDEGTGEKSSADDEENFKKLHKVDKKKHPVAGDNQFNGTTKKDKSKENADGEKKPLKTYKEMKEDFPSDDDEDDVKKAKKKDDEEDDEDKDEDEIVREGILNDLKKNVVVLKDKKKTKIKLKPADAKALKNAHDSLSGSNQKKWVVELLKDKNSFDAQLQFANQL